MGRNDSEFDDIPNPDTASLLKQTVNKRITTKGMKSLVPDKFKDLSIYDLPKVTVRKLGCVNCEWRGTSLCSHGLPKGSGHALNKMVIDGISLSELDKQFYAICDKRKWFILSCYSGKSKKPTHRQLMSDYRMGVLELGHMKDLNRLHVIDDRIMKLEDKSDLDDDEEKRLKQLKEERSDIHDEVNKVGLELLKHDNRVADRESRDKNVDKISKISFGDLNRVLTDDTIIEADWDEK